MPLPNVLPALLRAGLDLQQRAVRRVLRDYVRVLCSDDEREVQTPYGFRFSASARDWLSHTIYFYGTYDEPLTRFMQTHVLEGDVCWDVGAGPGWFSLLLARCVGASGRVDAFEAFPATHTKLMRHRDANGFDWLHTHRVAVSNTPGSRYFMPPQHVATRRAHNSGVGYLSVYEQPGCISVPTRRLDDFAREVELTRLDFVKFDIEGQETEALRGAEHTLRRFQPTLVVEYSPHALQRAGSSVAELDELLEVLGYERYVFTEKLERLRLDRIGTEQDTVFNVYCLPRRLPRAL